MTDVERARRAGLKYHKFAGHKNIILRAMKVLAVDAVRGDLTRERRAWWAGVLADRVAAASVTPADLAEWNQRYVVDLSDGQYSWSPEAEKGRGR